MHLSKFMVNIWNHFRRGGVLVPRAPRQCLLRQHSGPETIRVEAAGRRCLRSSLPQARLRRVARWRQAALRQGYTSSRHRQCQPGSDAKNPQNVNSETFMNKKRSDALAPFPRVFVSAAGPRGMLAAVLTQGAPAWGSQRKAVALQGRAAFGEARMNESKGNLRKLFRI